MYRISVSPEDIEKLEPAGFPGKIKVIDSTGLDFLKAVRYLKKQRIIGFDTESRPCFSSSQPHYGVSLLQLSGLKTLILFHPYFFLIFATYSSNPGHINILVQNFPSGFRYLS